jgi:hypothetical protein
MNHDEITEGGCLCGALRYRIGGPVGPAVHCHCAMCRRSGGGAVATWISVARDRFAFTKGEPRVYRSSAQAERRFCPRCGAQLTFWSEHHPEFMDVTVGTLDRPDRLRADHHIWTDSRLPWLRLDEDLPGYPGDAPAEAEA